MNFLSVTRFRDRVAELAYTAGGRGTPGIGLNFTLNNWMRGIAAALLCGAACTLAAVPDALQAELDAIDSLPDLQDFDARAAAGQADPYLRAELLRLIGYQYENFNAKHLAYDAFDRSVRLLETLPPSDQLVYSLGERSYISYLRTGDREQYCPDRERAVSVAREIAEPEALVAALLRQAFCFDQAETMQRAMGDLQEAMAIAREAKLAQGAQAMIFNASGNLFRGLQLSDRAYSAYHDAYLIWREQGEVPDYFNMLHNLVGEAILLGRWDDAEQHSRSMAQVAQREGNDNDYAFFSYFNEGRLALARDQYPRAEQAFSMALELAATTVETRFVARSRLLRSAARLWQGNLAGAREDLLAYQPGALESDGEFVFYDAFTNALESGDIQGILLALNNWRQGERDKRIAFLDSNTRYFTGEHERQVAAYESDLLKQRLALQDLELARASDRTRLARQSNLILALLAAILVGLASWLVYRLRLHRELAYTDYLTGIANRARVFERGTQLFQRALRKDQALAVVLIDLDHFKTINDRYGHDVGDRALRSTVAALDSCLRSGELLGRLGGEEFIVVLPRHTLEQARVRAELLRRAVKERACFEHAGSIRVEFTASMGVAAGNVAGGFQELVNRADAALYGAKSGGRDRVLTALDVETPEVSVVGSRKLPRSGSGDSAAATGGV